MVLRPSASARKEVRIYPLKGDRGITRWVSHEVFSALVGSEGVAGYTVPLSGPAIIITNPGTRYSDEEKRFVIKK